MSLAEARVAATEALKAMRDGVFSSDKASRLFEDVLSDWYDREQRNRKSFRQVENAMKLHALPHLKGREIQDIRKADLVRIIDRVADSGARTQANRVRAFIKRYFAWACERDLLDFSPAASLPKVGGEQSRDRVLTESELRSVWYAADAIGYPFGPIVKLLILTAQRRDEVAGMTWSELDLDRGTWTIGAERAKNGQTHTVHLSPAAQAILEQIPQRSDSDFVFTTTGTSAVSGFSKAKARLDQLSAVNEWRLHDLRRTAATMMAERLEVGHAVVDKVLNHRSGAIRGVAAVYLRGQFLKERQSALFRWGTFVHELVNLDN
ncbi:site-specific recombinase, phage integrase family protein [Roseobacter sp. AzwK-3b]|nr:site-specific recombinase, phage integrase family protein [Roseobacter sp. AzwK-3b]